MKTIFVSHSEEDAHIVDQIIKHLRYVFRNDYEIWNYREQMVGGKDWRSAIPPAIEKSNFFLLIITTNSRKSENVHRELELADENKIRKIPVLINIDRIPDEMVYSLAGIQYIQFKEEDFDNSINEIQRALSEKVPFSVERIGVLDRGEFTEYVVDSAFSFKDGYIDLFEKFRSELKHQMGKKNIDLKYHYLGVTCAPLWIALSGHPDYGHGSLVNILDVCFGEVIDRCNFGDADVDLISLGSGDGRIDAILLRKITEKVKNFQYYYCLDLSFELLQKAVFYIVKTVKEGWYKKKFFIKAIQGDFNQLNQLATVFSIDKSANIFTLTGFTLGNFMEPQLLKDISNGMNKGDFLFLDARLHQFKDWDGSSEIMNSQKQLILLGYNNDLNNRFAFGPVDAVTDISSKEVKFDYETNSEVTVVPKAFNLITYCKDLEGKIIGTGEVFHIDRLNLTSTTYYDYDELRKWLETRGFDLKWDKKIDNVGLFLLQKR